MVYLSAPGSGTAGIDHVGTRVARAVFSSTRASSAPLDWRWACTSTNVSAKNVVPSSGSASWFDWSPDAVEKSNFGPLPNADGVRSMKVLGSVASAAVKHGPPHPAVARNTSAFALSARLNSRNVDGWSKPENPGGIVNGKFEPFALVSAVCALSNNPMM